MKRIILMIVLFAGIILPQDYAVKDTVETAMQRLERLAREIDSTVTANIDSKVNLTVPNPVGATNYPSYQDFYEAMMDSIAHIWVQLGRDTIPPPPTYPPAPTNFALVAATGEQGAFTLTWNSSDTILVYEGTASGNLVLTATLIPTISQWVSTNYPAGTTRYYALRNRKNNLLSPWTAILSGTITAPPTGEVLYVGVSATGNGSGSSTANMVSFESLRGNWDNIRPGTTVYIDGGTDSLFYNINGTSGVDGYAFNPQGTAAQPILVTKNTETNHNGKVIFRKNNTTGGIIGLNISGTKNTIIDNIDFQGKVTTISQTYLVFIYTGSTTDVTFQYCTFRMFYSEGVGTNGSSETSNNIKFLYCDFLNLIDTGTNSAMDMMWLGGTGHTNWEIAYCNFINDNPKTGATQSSSHRDLIQCEAGFGRGGIINFHHNLFADISAGAAGACIESEHLEGTYLITDNVFYSNCAGTNNTLFWGILSLTAQLSATNTTCIVLNNTFIGADEWVRTPSMMQWDRLYFVNNIVYFPLQGEYTPYVLTVSSTSRNGTMVCDYNQYYTPASHVFTDELQGNFQGDFSEWQGLGYDLHGSFRTKEPDFVNAGSIILSDYALDTGSDGIDEGMISSDSYYPTLAGYVPNDALGVSRPQGTAYDIGAFEYLTGGGTVRDTIPAPFSFTAVTNAELSTTYISNGVVLAGFDTTTHIYSIDAYRIGVGGPWQTGWSTVEPSNIVYLQLTSSDNYSTAVSCTLTIGGVNGIYTVTTKADPGGAPTYKFFENFSDGNYTSNPTWTVRYGGGLTIATGLTIPWAGTNNSAIVGSDDCYFYATDTATVGTWEWDFYTGPSAAGTYLNVFYLDANTEVENDGMEVEMLNNKALTVYELGVETHFATATAYLVVNTWYGMKITRTSAGLTTFYIRGGIYGVDYVEIVETTGANPFTDTHANTCNYFQIGIGEGRMITNIKVY